MCKLSEGLKTVDAKVSELKANFEALMKEAAEIKISLDEEQVMLLKTNSRRILMYL